MALDAINTGSAPNDGTGDTVRDAFIKVNGNFTQVLQLAGGTLSGPLILFSDPTAALGAATKQYVDAIASGLDPKAACRLLADSNHGLSGLADIDGVTPSSGDRILCIGQSDASENGIYVAASGAWARASDADEDEEVTSGLYTVVTEGDTYALKAYILTTNDPITVDTSNLIFELFSDPTAAIDEAKKSTRGRVEQSTSYQLVSEDGGKTVVLTGSTPRNFTIHVGRHAEGDQGIIRQEGTGQITLLEGTSTTFRYHSDFVAKTKGQWSWIAWEKISSTEIALTGHMELAP